MTNLDKKYQLWKKKYFTLFNEIKTCKNIINTCIGNKNSFFQ